MFLAGAECFYTPFAVFFGDGYTVGADGGLTPVTEKSRRVRPKKRSTESSGPKTGPELLDSWLIFNTALSLGGWGSGGLDLGG